MTQFRANAPNAKTIPHTFEKHGRTFVDDYAWLQNRDDPEVVAYLEDENSAPERRGDTFYYWRMQPGQQYRLFCRKHGSLDAPHELAN